jgi:hypothetical protein
MKDKGKDFFRQWLRREAGWLGISSARVFLAARISAKYSRPVSSRPIPMLLTWAYGVYATAFGLLLFLFAAFSPFALRKTTSVYSPDNS